MNQEDEFRILLEAGFSGMASSWTEFLCLERRGGEVTLSRRGYEVLGELSKYAVRDEEGDFLEYRVPETIDGVAVTGDDGEYVFGGSLMLHDDESEFTVDPENLEDARAWLKQHEWDTEPGFEGAWKEICTAVGAEEA
jgi:hypothetical protein